MNTDDFDFPGILIRVVAAVVILVITAFIAKLVKAVLAKQLVKVDALQKEDSSGHSLGESLATIASLVIWLFGLTAVLNLFGLTNVVAPIQDLLNGILGALPGIIGAALIFFIGFIVAKIVRQIVTTALESAGADSLLEKGQRAAGGTTTSAAGAQTTQTMETGAGTKPPVKLSEVAGQIVFALILIVISISALQVLGIEAISGPATEMLSLILNTIPLILSAAVLLAIGYLIGKFVAPLLESTLRGLGTDRALADVGVSTGSTSPSALIGRLVHVAIVLFFAIAATRVLGFPEVTAILDAVLQIGGQVVFGGAVIAVGVLIAGILATMVSGQAAQVVRWATIGLFVAMGLQFMGLADTIVTLAFGSVVVGTALAAALAFGLGGRDAAARQLEQLQSRATRPAERSEVGSTDAGSDGPTAP